MRTRREKRMKELSAEVLSRLTRAAPRDDEEIFTALGGVLTELRGRPVVLRRFAFPPGTASGLWLDLEDMDILAVRDDAANSEHEHVILGHEIWHMFEGHRGEATAGGHVAARTPLAATQGIGGVVRELMASATAFSRGESDASGVPTPRVAARTGFDVRHEAEAEMFGLRLGTDLRAFRRSRRRADLGEVAGRIEDSLGRGLWG
ncbi:toxin-antitoxin system, toxin component [Streptomyces sp. RY43-2]|uniref:Toxin-antitoxin system, toxin component n=1 Tax=Streptomyces macrolidinus TaxID=2952607 RepID=A0ABT0ZDA9_9ACTN|nr:toxin-antitoxin system, toxin component [Streptomyces macrolidinus]MCN9241557.1 toxin-antitoxin system, toxin component [Streptomyces macrolidinus]